jgi:hypothetical protein
MFIITSGFCLFVHFTQPKEAVTSSEVDWILFHEKFSSCGLCMLFHSYFELFYAFYPGESK